MTARTDIQILKLRLPLLVKVAEITVPRGIETSIQKTALEEDEFIALGDRLINEIFFGFGAEIVVVKARTRIDNAAGLPFFIGLASFQVLANFLRNRAASILCCGRRDMARQNTENSTRFSASILVSDHNSDCLSDGGLRRESSIVRPTDARCAKIIFSCEICVFSPIAVALLIGCVSLFGGGCGWLLPPVRVWRRLR